MEKNSFLHENKLSLIIWFRLLRFYHRSNQLSNENLKRFGISINQFHTLAQIYFFQPITQMELADYMIISRGGVTHMLNRLEKDGLIERKQEWKVKYITLTEKGMNLVEETLPSQSDLQASLFNEVLTEEEKEQLLSIMEKIDRHSVNKQVPNSNDE